MDRPREWALVGARIRTLDPARPWATALLVRGGLIAVVGDDDEVQAAARPGAPVLDGTGMWITPGLIDAHQHPVWGAILTEGVDLAGVGSLEELRAVLARERAEAGPGGWVRGWNLDYSIFGDEPLGSAAFEDVLDDAPAILICFDLHTAVASRAALAAAGIDGPVEFADASEVVCVEGRPTGELREPSAYDLVLAAAPSGTDEAVAARVRTVLAEQHALGLTGVHVMDGGPATFELLDDLEERGELAMRMVVPLWETPAISDETLAEHLELVGRRGLRWRGGVAKFFLDGVIDSGTAWLHEPDAAGDGTLPFWPDVERYREVVARMAGAGFQCVTHAVGDRAVREVLDAYAAAGRAPNTAPHRVEHLETLTDDDVLAVGRSGVTASMQPLHMQWRDPGDADPWARRLGPRRTADAFRTRDLLEAGARMALGSDWPVASFDPRLGMAWARGRRRPGDPDGHVFEPSQRLTGLEALKGMTAWAAAAVGEGSLGGRITPGLRADLTGWAADPVLCSVDDLVDLPVVTTVVGGDVVHAAPDARVPDGVTPGA